MLSTRNKACFMSVITILAMVFSFANVSPAEATGLGPNLANGEFTGGLARPVQVAAYGGASVYDSNAGFCGDYWQLVGTLCDEAPTTHSPTISTKTNTHSGATYNNFDFSGTGVLVVDLGVVQTFNQVNVFQMFSDGKTTHFRISTHAESGSTAPDWQDAGWTPLNGFDFIGPGVDLGGGQVGDPTVIPLPTTSSRYVMVEVRNDGSHGVFYWIELRAFKLFLTTETIAPTASATQSPTANGANWNNSDVTVTWNWTDNSGGSGIDNANCTISSTSTGEGNPITLNATCKDLAGNTGNASYDVKVDKTLPTVSLVDGPADGGSYYFGSVPAAPTCSASDALSDLDGSCAVSGYSALVGSQTVSATAQDMAGNQNSVSASYTVLAWTTNGFFQPVDMGGVWNTVKNGSTVPLKFEVFAGSTELTSTSIINQPLTATQALCSGGPTDDIELFASGATSLRYDITSSQFIYNWQTPKKAGYCYVVTVKLADGSTISANFKLK